MAHGILDPLKFHVGRVGEGREECKVVGHTGGREKGSGPVPAHGVKGPGTSLRCLALNGILLAWVL